MEVTDKPVDEALREAMPKIMKYVGGTNDKGEHPRGTGLCVSACCPRKYQGVATNTCTCPFQHHMQEIHGRKPCYQTGLMSARPASHFSVFSVTQFVVLSKYRELGVHSSF